MIIKFIEAAHPVTAEMPLGGNHGKFMIARFVEEWLIPSSLGSIPEAERAVSLLRSRGWDHHHLLFVDLQTGEGCILYPGGVVSADLNKHAIWVCPLAEPFLEWLYQQDLSDITRLPAYVELPEAPFAVFGHRRPGLGHTRPTVRGRTNEHQ